MCKVILPAVLLCAVLAPAQESRREPVGSVSGHVLCADTQRPARLAAVRLVRVPAGGPPAKGTRVPMGGGAPMGDAVETGLDGAYTIGNVKPGEYYVVVDKEGYLLPLAQFTADELAAKDEPTRIRVDRAVHTITVRGDNTTVEDVRLERGASVVGRAMYDDGTPAAGLRVKLLQKDAKGRWVEVQNGRYRENFGFIPTDDMGTYRLTGLPAGDYVTEIDLTLSDHETTFLPMPGNPDGQIEMHSDKTRFSLPLYSGDKLRRQTAEAYSLGSGQELTAADVVFPLAKLHKVSGQLLAARRAPADRRQVGADVGRRWRRDDGSQRPVCRPRLPPGVRSRRRVQPEGHGRKGHHSHPGGERSRLSAALSRGIEDGEDVRRGRAAADCEGRNQRRVRRGAGFEGQVG